MIAYKINDPFIKEKELKMFLKDYKITGELFDKRCLIPAQTWCNEKGGKVIYNNCGR